MEALQGWIEKEGFITPCDVSTKEEESNFQNHSHSIWSTLFLSLKLQVKSYEKLREKDPQNI